MDSYSIEIENLELKLHSLIEEERKAAKAGMQPTAQSPHEHGFSDSTIPPRLQLQSPQSSFSPSDFRTRGFWMQAPLSPSSPSSSPITSPSTDLFQIAPVPKSAFPSLVKKKHVFASSLSSPPVSAPVLTSASSSAVAETHISAPIPSAPRTPLSRLVASRLLEGTPSPHKPRSRTSSCSPVLSSPLVQAPAKSQFLGFTEAHMQELKELSDRSREEVENTQDIENRNKQEKGDDGAEGSRDQQLRSPQPQFVHEYETIQKQLRKLQEQLGLDRDEEQARQPIHAHNSKSEIEQPVPLTPTHHSRHSSIVQSAIALFSNIKRALTPSSEHRSSRSTSESDQHKPKSAEETEKETAAKDNEGGRPDRGKEDEASRSSFSSSSSSSTSSSSTASASSPTASASSSAFSASASSSSSASASASCSSSSSSAAPSSSSSSSTPSSSSVSASSSSVSSVSSASLVAVAAAASTFSSPSSFHARSASFHSRRPSRIIAEEDHPQLVTSVLSPPSSSSSTSSSVPSSSASVISSLSVLSSITSSLPLSTSSVSPSSSSSGTKPHKKLFFCCC